MATLIVTTKSDVVNPRDGLLSLREALAQADATPSVADTVRFDTTTMGGSRIVLRGSELTVGSDVTIDGGKGVTIDANEGSRVLHIEGRGTDVSLSQLTVTGGLVSSSSYASGGYYAFGGGIRHDGRSLTLTDVEVIDNAVTGEVGASFPSGGAYGGGISATGRLTLVRSSVSGNSAGFDLDLTARAQFSNGGGIFATADLLLDDSNISGNSSSGGASGRGGGVSGTYIFARGTTFSDNGASGGFAEGLGGGIFGDKVRLEHCEIESNSTGAGRYGDAAGGGVYSIVLRGNSNVISGNSVRGDEYGAEGGGIKSQIIHLTTSTIEGNNATANDRGGASGGGVVGYEIRMKDCLVAYNFAAGGLYGANSGGGIDSKTVLYLENSTIFGNSVFQDSSRGGRGGGLSANNSVIINCSITNNISSNSYESSSGGGIFGQAEIVNSIIAGNIANSGTDISGDITSSNGHNIFGSDVVGNAPGDLENVPTSRLFVGGLADNGGPTLTVALRDAADNPALAGADPADAPATDQRGVTRPLPAGTNPDIGAFELDQSADMSGVILGTNRRDVLLGTDGPDIMKGFGGNDTLRGYGGNDQLFGGTGNDVLFGKAGLDLMQGDAGADRFVLRLLSDAPADGPAYDEILDFCRRQHDRIDVSPPDAKAGAAGNQSFAFIGEAEFTAAGQLRYEAIQGGEFLVQGNVDRNLDADFALVVHTDLAGLKASDFLL